MLWAPVVEQLRTEAEALGSETEQAEAAPARKIAPAPHSNREGLGRGPDVAVQQKEGHMEDQAGQAVARNSAGANRGE